MKTGIELIAIERAEQIEKHGRTVELDVKQNDNYQLSDAASHMVKLYPSDAGDFTPNGWDDELFDKMCAKDYKERLIIGGALIAAEIDRITYEETQNNS